MTIKKNRDNLVKTGKSQKIMTQESTIVRDGKAITAVLGNYATKGMDFTGMSADEKKQKEGKLYQATKTLTDALGATGLVEHLLSTQLLDIHELQQKLIVYANRSMHYPEENQYYINAVTKLSHAFVSQITLLQKLQGQSQQKVSVEHLHIHQGAQTIVGQINANNKGVANEK
ncbi:TPA: hypothetical protein JBC17_11260 [Legionella pneumophila subsp. pneumophila]|nr:hypothetical protein [Legionella pneumophila subsp. pneumophila]